MILTTEADGAPRETTVWLVVVDGQGYVRTGDTHWHGNIARDPKIGVRIADRDYAVTAEHVTDPALRAKIDGRVLREVRLLGHVRRLVHGPDEGADPGARPARARAARAVSGEVLRESARELPVLARADVLVVGGGTAGVAAAVAAARSGARVVLAEASSSLGGLATNGLIALLLTLDDGRGRQVIGGLCQEVTERMTALGGAFAPPPEHWGRPDPELVKRYAGWGLVWGGARAEHVVRYSVAYDPEVLREVLNDLVTQAGVELLLPRLGRARARRGRPHRRRGGRVARRPPGARGRRGDRRDRRRPRAGQRRLRVRARARAPVAVVPDRRDHATSTPRSPPARRSSARRTPARRSCPGAASPSSSARSTRPIRATSPSPRSPAAGS